MFNDKEFWVQENNNQSKKTTNNINKTNKINNYQLFSKVYSASNETERDNITNSADILGFKYSVKANENNTWTILVVFSK